MLPLLSGSLSFPCFLLYYFPLCHSSNWVSFFHFRFMHKIDLIVRLNTFLLLCCRCRHRRHHRCRVILLLVAPLSHFLKSICYYSHTLCASLSLTLYSVLTKNVYGITWMCGRRASAFCNKNNNSSTGSNSNSGSTKKRRRRQRRKSIYLHTFHILTCNLFKINFSSVA